MGVSPRPLNSSNNGGDRAKSSRRARQVATPRARRGLDEFSAYIEQNSSHPPAQGLVEFSAHIDQNSTNPERSGREADSRERRKRPDHLHCCS
jgi:hypothetical protein